MSAYCAAFESPVEANEAVERLLADGVADADVRVLMGADRHDVREEPVGTFAGPSLDPAAPAGTFSGAPVERADAMGGFAGDRGTAPIGSFASIDRETVTRPGRMREVHDVGHQRLRELLMEAGLDAETADRDVQALHQGRVLVLVRPAAGLEERVQALLAPR